MLSKDYPSRGTTGSVLKLITGPLWFFGPDWITNIEDRLVQKSYQNMDRSDKIQIDPILTANQSVLDIIRFFSLDKLMNTIQLVNDFQNKRTKMEKTELLNIGLNSGRVF